MTANPTCASCGEPLTTPTSTCETCGNNPRRFVRKYGLIIAVLAMPAFLINPPLGVILAIVAVFALIGSLFVSSAHQATTSSETA